MLEGIVVTLLNKYLGEFLEGLNKEQLKLSVFSGQVALKNLKIKPSGLDFLHLPVKVKAGYVGNLYLEANWRKLGSQPVKVFLDNVFLIAEPRTEFKVDEEAEKKKATANKLEELKATERIKVTPETQDTKAVAAADDGFAARTVAKIIDNIQIRVANIHIRYEDASVPSRPLAFGIVLQLLQAQTVDANGKETFVVGEKTTFKLVTLQNLCVYFNTQGTVNATPLKSVDDLGALFKQIGQSGDKSQYVLRPISGNLKLRLNKDTNPPPKVKVDAELQCIGISLIEVQYHSLLQVVSRITNAQAKKTAMLSRYTEAFRSGKDNEMNEYVKLYKMTLNTPSLPEPTEADTKKREEMERDTLGGSSEMATAGYCRAEEGASGQTSDAQTA